MNFTPQTDAEEGWAYEWSYSSKVVPASFARSLVRQLTTANAKIIELQGQLIAQARRNDENYNFSVRC